MVFLRLNPMVGTFEWAEILAKCKEDQANGNEHSKEWAILESYTKWRSKKMAELDAKLKEERARNTRVRKKLSDFGEMYKSVFDLRKADKIVRGRPRGGLWGCSRGTLLRVE